MSHAFFPFHALGYDCNPFRTLTPDEWAQLAIIPAPIVEAAEAGHHIQVTGRKGRGKTSTLRGLALHLERMGRTTTYEHLPVGQRQFTATPGAVYLLDEAQRLSLAERGRLLELAPHTQLIIGTHLTFQPDFLLRGLRLRGFRMGHHSHDHIRRIVRARLAFFQRGAAPALTLSDAALYVIAKPHGSDLRAIEEALYTLFQAAAQRGLRGTLTPQVVADLRRDTEGR